MFNHNARIIQITLLAFAMALVSAFGFTPMVSAQADVCPSTGDWVKIDGISAQSYTYNAPEGKLIVESCYKAGTTLVFASYNPGVESVTLITNVDNPVGTGFIDISHASFRLANASTPDPTPDPPSGPTPDPTPDPPSGPTPDPPSGPTPDPTPGPNPGDDPEPTPDPTNEPTPESEGPEEQPVSTPAPVVAPVTGATSGPAALVVAAASTLGLSGLSLGIWFKRRNK
jgi:hypothetical protein